jgi:hypothetical protein
MYVSQRYPSGNSSILTNFSLPDNESHDGYVDDMAVLAFDSSYFDLLNKTLYQQNTLTLGCPVFRSTLLPANGLNQITFSQEDIVDPEQAIKMNQDSCGLSAAAKDMTSSYRLYDLSANHYGRGSPSSGGCYTPMGDHVQSPSCGSRNRLQLKSNMVSQQRSRRGTDWVQILTDESAIAGGIVFFTWFLGIYDF